MDTLRLTLVELTVTGPGKRDALVRFAPGLNLIVGASDTGKTLVFEAVNYMLGSNPEGGLRRIPESNGYDNVCLSIDPTARAPFTLKRAYTSGHFELTEFPGGRDNPPSSPKVLKAAHTPDPDDSLSSYLLRAIGMEGREVCKNANGVKRALSFRDVSHLCLIDEERVIQKTSPVFTGQVIHKTAERNVFAFFLTGVDDSRVIPQESREDRNSRLDMEATVVQSILEEKRRELGNISPDPNDLPQQINRLEQAIEEVSQAVVTTQDRIKEIAEVRSGLFDQITRAQARVIFLREQLKRFRLLDDFYKSDRNRLEGVIEASKVLHEMPEGTCPLCNQPFLGDSTRGGSHEAFEEACQRESDKIIVLQQDLRVAVDDFSAEEESLDGRIKTLSGQMRDADNELQRVLTPALGKARAQMQELLRARMAAAQGESIRSIIRNLTERLERVELARQEKIPKLTLGNRATTGVAADFCKIVEGILKAWKYPNLGSVVFDTSKADLVIGGQDRITKGKGYRAITYAAFAIGLMRYCRQKGIPHPGVVVLDTPINPFKGPDKTTPEDQLTDEIKVAFYEHLSADESGDQIIIMENEEPPELVRSRVNYYRFTKNPDLGRYGFFMHRAAANGSSQTGTREEAEDYLEYLRSLSEDEVAREIDNKISATNNKIIETEEFGSAMAVTNASFWGIDEYDVQRFEIGDAGCTVQLTYSASGEQDDERMFFGNCITGKATGIINPDGTVEYQDVTAEVDHGDASEAEEG